MTAYLANLGAGLAVAGVLTATRTAIGYDLSDLGPKPVEGWRPPLEAWSRLWHANMSAWKIVALGAGR